MERRVPLAGELPVLLHERHRVVGDRRLGDVDPIRGAQVVRAADGKNESEKDPAHRGGLLLGCGPFEKENDIIKKPFCQWFFWALQALKTPE